MGIGREHLSKLLQSSCTGANTRNRWVHDDKLHGRRRQRNTVQFAGLFNLADFDKDMSGNRIIFVFGAFDFANREGPGIQAAALQNGGTPFFAER